MLGQVYFLPNVAMTGRDDGKRCRPFVCVSVTPTSSGWLALTRQPSPKRRRAKLVGCADEAWFNDLRELIIVPKERLPDVLKTHVGQPKMLDELVLTDAVQQVMSQPCGTRHWIVN